MKNPHGVATPDWMYGQGWALDTDSLVAPELLPMRKGDVVAWRVKPASYQWWFGVVRDGALFRIPGLMATNRGGVEWMLDMLMHMRYRVG